MPCFDDRAPSQWLLIESKPSPWITKHVLEVRVPELPRIYGAGIRILERGYGDEDERLRCSIFGKLLPDDDDGA